MDEPKSRLKIIQEEVALVIDKATKLQKCRKHKEAKDILTNQIKLLIKDRASYLAIGRGMGAITGAVFGYILSVIIPGGSLATLIPGLLGTGYLGERVGKYTGEKLTEDEYYQVLKDLHYQLLMPESDCNSNIGLCNSDPDLIPYWKSLLIIETPMNIFATTTDSGSSITARLIRSVKRLIGTNLFALAVEATTPESKNFTILKEMAANYLSCEIQSNEAKMVACRIYNFDRDDTVINRLLCSIYYIEMADFESVRNKHQLAFKEHVSELFKKDLRANPESVRSIRNLAQCYLEEHSITSDTVPVYRKAVAKEIDPLPLFALALIKALDWKEAALLKEPQAMMAIIRAQEELVEKGLITTEKLHLIEKLQAEVIANRVSSAESSPAANEEIDLLVRVYKRDQTITSNNLCLGRIFLEGKLGERLSFDTIMQSLFPLRNMLSQEHKEGLIKACSKEDSGKKTIKLYEATMLVEAKRGEEALTILKKIRENRGEGLSAWEKLESARLLAVANKMTGHIKRAWELFKGITLVETSDILIESIFEFAVNLITVHERPAMARNVFTLIRSCDPDYTHPVLGPVSKYYKEFESVFDYYEEDSIQKVGGGGMAVVFSGTETTTGQTHIIKQLRTDIGTPSETKRFQRLFSSEIKAIRKLNESDHPGAKHIVKLYYESMDENSFCYSMEKLDIILSDLTAEQKLSQQESIRIIRDMGMGLACAHSEGIIHRDLNPRNGGIKDDVVKIFDFGTAHILRTTIHLRRGVDSLSERDSENIIMGTPCYMSPEQAAGRQFDERTDIFSLGCVAFELLTGQLAFPGRLGSQVLTVGNGDETLNEIRSRLEADKVEKTIIETILKSLSPFPEDRQDSADEFIKAFL